MKSIFCFISRIFKSKEESNFSDSKIEPTIEITLSDVHDFTHEFIRQGLLDLKTKKMYSSAYYEIYKGNEKGVLIEIGNLQKVFVNAKHIKNFPLS
jgi:hypothetical protein